MIETYFLHILLYLAIVAGIALVFLGLPGTWLMVIATLGYAGFADFGEGGEDKTVLGLLIFAAVIAELFALLVGMLGAKVVSVSTGAIVSSIVGGILGALIGVPVFLIGPLLGLLLGAFLGAFAYEVLKTSDVPTALKTAGAVFLSRIVAIFFKATIACGMGTYLVWKTL